MPHILIIDDSITVAYAMGKLLERQGFVVTIANDGASGLQTALEVNPDVIIMDLLMPGMDGFQATRKIKNNVNLKQVPIIVHSSKSMPLDRKWALKQGAAAFVEKPATEYELIKAITPFLTEKEA